MNTAKRYPTHKPPRPRSGAAPTALRSRGRRRRSAAHQRCPIMVHYFAKTGAVTRHTTIGTPARSERSTIGSIESHTPSEGHVMLWGQSRPQCPQTPLPLLPLQHATMHSGKNWRACLSGFTEGARLKAYACSRTCKLRVSTPTAIGTACIIPCNA